MTELFTSLPETVKYIIATITLAVAGACGSWLTVKRTKAQAAKSEKEARQAEIETEQLERNEEHRESMAKRWEEVADAFQKRMFEIQELNHVEMNELKEQHKREITELKSEIDRLRIRVNELEATIAKERIEFYNTIQKLQQGK